ncbi:hypothetical protein [Priestia megaterium]|uniref:hypothetical protein n=1 Tax=Priestia megaterium TaxID=1404 RepID=UPI000BFD433A|nr:hypothetical protein [Priestia megaterium]PGQ88210.1 hypothetical protein COA18_04605 [Priestia megaterium]
MEEKKREELLKLVKGAMNEMKENKGVVLIRADKFQEREAINYGVMYSALSIIQGLLEHGLHGPVEVAKVVRHKNLAIFEKYETMCMDLFETHRFPILFELYEYE